MSGRPANNTSCEQHGELDRPTTTHLFSNGVGYERPPMASLEQYTCMSSMSPSSESSFDSGVCTPSDTDASSVGAPLSPCDSLTGELHSATNAFPGTLTTLSSVNRTGDILATHDVLLNIPKPAKQEKFNNKVQTSATRSSVPGEAGVQSKRPAESYLAMIGKALLSTADKRLILGDIYQYITDNYPYYATAKPNWKNAVRHNLSRSECFIKNGRAEGGRGYYWSIHPACMEAFLQGDFTRREARRRAQLCDKSRVTPKVKSASRGSSSRLNGYSPGIYTPMTAVPYQPLVQPVPSGGDKVKIEPIDAAPYGLSYQSSPSPHMMHQHPGFPFHPYAGYYLNEPWQPQCYTGCGEHWETPNTDTQTK